MSQTKEVSQAFRNSPGSGMGIYFSVLEKRYCRLGREVCKILNLLGILLESEMPERNQP
jgi:hypothetical protein